MSEDSKKPKRIKTEEPNLYLVGEVYYYRKGDFEESLGKFPKLRQAIEYKRIFEIMRDSVGSAAYKFRVKDLWDKYEAERIEQATVIRPGRRQLSARTIQEMKNVYRIHLRPFFGNKKLAEIDDVLWNQFVKRSELNDLSNARKVFGHFCRWCKSHGYMRVLPEFKIPHHNRRVRRTLTDDQVRALFSHSDGTLRLFLSLYLFMGVRRGEQIKLKWDSIDMIRKSLLVRAETSRTRRAREIPLNAHVHMLLLKRRSEQVQAGLDTPFVFPKRGNEEEHMTETGIQKSWHTALKNAGLKDLDIKPHDLRATFEHHAHLRSDFTDTQREKMAGASIEVQRRIYLNAFGADQLRGLEEVVRIKGLDELFDRNDSEAGKKTGKGER